MKTKIKGLLTLLLVLLVQSIFAQTRTITGTVLDESGVVLPGATVLVVNTTRGVSTDMEGKFSITAATGDRLQITFVGYETRTITIGAASEYNIHLVRSSSELDPVLIVGYGSGKKISNISGAISNVTADKLGNRPVANVMEALQGQVAGLQVFTSTGEPTATSSMRMHGVGSLSAGNQPLYILDGVPIEGTTFLSLNANDFESATLLKDATATSIYGSRASNGVLYITTKKGKEGDGEIKVNYEYGFSDLARRGKLGLMNSKQLLDFQLEKQYISQAYYNQRLASGIDTNWENYQFKDNAPTRQLDLSFSGGSAKTGYYISSNYLNQEGLTLDSGYERFTARANIDSEINNWASVGMRMAGSTDTRNTFAYGYNSLRGSLGVFMNEPYWTPYDEEGNVYDVIPGMGIISNEYALRMQPNADRYQSINGNFFIEIKPIKGLILKSQYGLNYNNERYTYRIYPSASFAQGIGERRETSALTFDQTITNTAEYKFSLDDDKHNITLLAGQEGIEYDYNSFNVAVRGMSDDRLMEFSAGSLSLMNARPGMSTTQYAFLSYFGQVNYDYKNKYYFDGSIRSDESSRFGKDNRRATFYSIGGMWVINKEDFLKDTKWVNDLRLRVSYGTMGNSDIGDYRHIATVGPGSPYATQVGRILIDAGNPVLGWEEQAKLSIGLATSLFENKLSIDLGYYLRKTNDMLMNVPQPYTTGFGSITENVGSMQNQGIDVTIGATLYQDRNWNVGFTKTFNYNKNKITGLFYGLDQWIIANTGVAYIKGLPVSYYYPKWLGIDPADGMQMWEDPNTGQAVKVFNENILAQNLKNRPRYAPAQGGFSINASWKKGLSLSADFAYVIDNYLLNNDRYFSENPAQFGGYNQSANVLDEWRKPGDVTKFPKFGQVMQFDSRLLENASFLRLKLITLAYDVPKTLLGEKNPFKGLRFSVSARNLFTITNYSGLDPEVDSNITLGQYPNTKQYIASVRATF